MTVIVPACQEPCCRVKRGETPYPETPAQVGKRIADVVLADIEKALRESGYYESTHKRLHEK